MKSRIILVFLVLALALTIVSVLGYGMAAYIQTTADQGDPTDPIIPPITKVAFPLLILIPYFLGSFVHWFKKYQLDGMNITFFKWLFQNIVWSVTALIVGLGSIWAMWLTTGHGGLYPVTIGSCIAVFWIGVGADTLNRTEKVTGVAGTGRSVMKLPN